ncbi:MAG: hypothetical protein ACREF1_07275, partial [Acetobacteraceae bacterium]
SGRLTVPVLCDARSATIVNKGSDEIILIFNSAFDGIGAAPGDFYPAPLRAEIDAANARVYATLNNGVYRAASRARNPQRHRPRLPRRLPRPRQDLHQARRRLLGLSGRQACVAP